MDEQVTQLSGEEKKQHYEKYVKGMTPVHNLFTQMAKAFVTGGVICLIGQAITNYCTNI